MPTCKKCGKDFAALTDNGMCQSCALNHSPQDKKCKDCGQEIISDDPSVEYCPTCKRKLSWKIKKGAQLLGVAALALIIIFKKRA